MRIESSTYSRNLISGMPQQQAQKNEETRVQNQKQVEQQQQTTKTQDTQNNAAVKLDVNLQNLPKSLDEVIGPDEKSMLDELFPGNGGNWGVGAYKMSSSANLSYSVGQKLDLTT